MKVKEQIHTDEYSIFNGDCMDVVTEMPDESVDLSVYSPPFAALYAYSSSERDMSNVSSNQEFLDQYEFLVKQMARVTKKRTYKRSPCYGFWEYSGYFKRFS